MIDMDVKTANVLFLEGKRERAAELYSELASEGDAEAAFNYAYCLLTGQGAQKNEALAKSYFTFALGLRGGDASYNLAVMYLHGTGVARDFSRAYSHMYDAARGGCIEAQLYLGIAHTLGSLFEPDIIAISRIPFHTPVYRTEGLYLGGDVPYAERDEELMRSAVRHDPESALRWFQIAARHDPTYAEELSQKSKFLYARCYIDGVGTDFNRERGNSLMLLAAADGSADAYAYLETEAPYVLEGLRDEELISRIRGQERILPPA